MHHALSILEIVEFICQQTSDSGRHLSVLARTSTIFQNPALNVLWAEQSTILNLLRCMPDDLWDISRTDYNPYITHIRLRRVITSTDWERPLLYSHRVRTFYMRRTCSPESSDAFEALRLSLAGQYLFPSLQSFHWFPPLELFPHPLVSYAQAKPARSQLYHVVHTPIHPLEPLPQLSVFERRRNIYPNA
ncbi:hypothetical protein DFH09DRAFT_909630 [Mycena vulgaris]|nr:hypothetical protein DFH09DRAFT_909630 [Mycena vulgaris]